MWECLRAMEEPQRKLGAAVRGKAAEAWEIQACSSSHQTQKPYENGICSPGAPKGFQGHVGFQETFKEWSLFVQGFWSCKGFLEASKVAYEQALAKKTRCDMEVPWVDCMGFSTEKKMPKGKQHADLEHWVARAIVLFPKAHVTWRMQQGPEHCQLSPSSKSLRPLPQVQTCIAECIGLDRLGGDSCSTATVLKVLLFIKEALQWP